MREHGLTSRWTIGRLQGAAEIPSGWQLERLVDVSTLESGHTPARTNPTYWDGDIPWVSLHDTSALSFGEIFDTKLMVTNEGISNSSARVLPKGTVALSRTATVGKAVLFGREMATSQDFACFLPSERVETRYLLHLFKSMAPEWRRLSAGSTHQTIYMPIFKRLQVLLPPMDEQRRIAEILDTIDGTIQATERVIAKLWDARVGLLRERLREVDSQYATAPLLSLVTLPTGQVDPKAEPFRSMTLVAPDHIVGGGRGRLLARESATAQGAISGKYLFRRGDVVYSKIRPELRKAWLADSAGLCSADMYPLTPGESLDGGYLAQVILGDRFSRFAASVSGRSSGMPKVNREELSEFDIAVPPAAVQVEIGRLALHCMARIDAEIAQLEKLTATRSGLAADLLSGRVRTVAA